MHDLRPWVYILASGRHGTLYVGVTSNLRLRVEQHKAKQHGGFTAKYGVDRLVWFEEYGEIVLAIAREKQMKKWRRDWKIALIEETNPEWADLCPTAFIWAECLNCVIPGLP